MKMRNSLQFCSKILSVTIAMVTALSTLCSSAHGQRNLKSDPPTTGNGINVEIAKVEGKYEAQQGTLLKISTADKSELFLNVSLDTSIRYSGEADPKWLNQGYMVRFSANFENGKAVAPIQKLEVFVPNIKGTRLSMERLREQTPGIYQEVANSNAAGKPDGAEKAAGAKQNLGAKPNTNNKPNAIGKPSAIGKPNSTGKPNASDVPAAGKPGDDKSQNLTAGGSQSYRIVAVIQYMQKNVLTLATGQQMLQVELDPDAQIMVTTTDLSMIKLGDSVAATGTRNTTQQPNLIQVETMEIKAAKKLTQDEPAMRGSRTRPNTRTKPGDADIDAKEPNKTTGKDGDKSSTKPNENKKTSRT